jgi:leucyl aminopeptidase
MKSFSALLALACLAVARPLSSHDGGQVVLGDFEEHDVNYPGFDLDLTSRRLIQMDGQAPVWMTELEKVWSACHTYNIFLCRSISCPDSSESTGD